MNSDEIKDYHSFIFLLSYPDILVLFFFPRNSPSVARWGSCPASNWWNERLFWRRNPWCVCFYDFAEVMDWEGFGQRPWVSSTQWAGAEGARECGGSAAAEEEQSVGQSLPRGAQWLCWPAAKTLRVGPGSEWARWNICATMHVLFFLAIYKQRCFFSENADALTSLADCSLFFFRRS